MVSGHRAVVFRCMFCGWSNQISRREPQARADSAARSSLLVFWRAGRCIPACFFWFRILLESLVMNWDNEEQSRVAGYRTEILDLLIAGPKENHELIPVTHRFSAVIHQLRAVGHLIESRHIRGGKWLYSYMGKTDVARVTRTMQAAYYQTAHWKSKRKERLEFDGKSCCQCKSRTDLEVHHWEYDLFKEDIHSLMTLCKDCHEHLHYNPRVTITFPTTVALKYATLLEVTTNGATRQTCDHAADKHAIIAGCRVVCHCGKLIGYTKQGEQISLF